MNKYYFSLAVVLLSGVTRSQTVFVPAKTSPITAFRYKCVLPKGWAPGITAEASFLEASFTGQPIFHCDRGLAIMSFASGIDIDGTLVPSEIALYDDAFKHGCAIAREPTASGELYAFFMNTPKRLLRMPSLRIRSTLLPPRHYAQIFVIKQKKIFRLTFSSHERDMVKEALSVARAYHPVGD